MFCSPVFTIKVFVLRYKFFNFFLLKIKLVKFYNIHYFIYIMKVSFSFYWFMFTDFPQPNSSKVLIWFLSFFVTFLTKPYNCRLSSSIFLVSLFHLLFLKLYFFIFTFLISCFNYLHFIAACFLDPSFPSLFLTYTFFQVYLFNCLE